MTTTADSQSLHSLLKTRTADLHQSVDDSLSRILGTDRDGYASFLLKMAGAILPLEEVFVAEGGSAIVPNWAERTRTADILADLADLGLQPECRQLQVVSCGEAGLLGILYVLEGSRLGGRVILSRLTHEPNTVPTRFLRHGHGKPLWMSFVAQLEASSAARSAPEELVAGAKTAFRLFQ